MGIGIAGRNGSRSLQRDLWSFSGAIKACGKAGHWEGALILFFSAQALRLGVNEVMMSSTVSACAKASRWQLAFLLVASAPQMSKRLQLLCSDQRPEILAPGAAPVPNDVTDLC